MKNLLIAGLFIGIVVLFIVGYNYWGWFGNIEQRNVAPEQFTRNGVIVNTNKQTTCPSECWEQYPAGSIYHPYYYCKTNCGKFIREQQPVYYVSPIREISIQPTPTPTPTPEPLPTGAPRG